MAPVADMPPAVVSHLRKSKATSKHERVHLRVTHENKELLEQAASLSGINMTDYATQVLIDAALSTIERHRITQLSARASAAFMQALDNDDDCSGTQELFSLFSQVDVQ